MVTEYQAKEFALKVLRRELNSATASATQALCALSATKAGRAEWLKHNPDDGVGGFSQCPYDTNHAERVAKSTAEEAELRQAAYDLAYDQLRG